MEKKKKRLIYRTSILGILAIMVVYAVYQGINDEPETALTTLKEVAPNFSGKTLTGDSLVLQDEMQGKTLINFWGTWCEPCKREMPALENAYSTYKSEGFNVISINLGQSDFVTRKFVE